MPLSKNFIKYQILYLQSCIKQYEDLMRRYPEYKAEHEAVIKERQDRVDEYKLMLKGMK